MTKNYEETDRIDAAFAKEINRFTDTVSYSAPSSRGKPKITKNRKKWLMERGFELLVYPERFK